MWREKKGRSERRGERGGRGGEVEEKGENGGGREKITVVSSEQ